MATRIARVVPRRARTGRTRAPRSAGSARRRIWRWMWATPLAVRLMVGLVVVVVWSAANWMDQDPQADRAALPGRGALVKTPASTWREYGPLFREHSTSGHHARAARRARPGRGCGRPRGADALALALARNPFEWYRPASSAVGMYQITDATFRDARRYCIHDHVVAEDGRGDRDRAGSTASIPRRSEPRDRDDRRAARSGRCPSGARRIASPRPPHQKQDLAAVIHLCGGGAGDDLRPAWLSLHGRPAVRRPARWRDYLARVKR